MYCYSERIFSRSTNVYFSDCLKQLWNLLTFKLPSALCGVIAPTLSTRFFFRFFFILRNSPDALTWCQTMARVTSVFSVHPHANILKLKFPMHNSSIVIKNIAHRFNSRFHCLSFLGLVELQVFHWFGPCFVSGIYP